ncbi:hypothetical protein MACH26_05980 [Planctobacterium marinum]|uniref:DUF4397 domain-containing protein n=2 Tax=Planctobacterium marinum TaxID=1631968 RepID=A0AA48HK66_9ALTE|nr:hypothetical protein MACH26_05980 [Planctobacterium marinum]
MVDDASISSSSYGDVTALYSYDADSYDIGLSWYDSDGQEYSITESEMQLDSSYKTIMLLGGDFETPDVVEFAFQRSELEDEFYLYAMMGAADLGNYDLYMAESGVPFEDANYIANLSYLQPEKVGYWEPEDDDFAWPTEDYKIFLVDPDSGEMVFESQELVFNYASDYLLSVRKTSGANENNIVVDIILNSTNISAEQDIAATAQYRVYSAMQESVELTVIVDDADEQFTTVVEGGELSAYTSVEFGDYQISASSTEGDYSFDGRLMTLNQGESKTIVMFEDADVGLTSLTLDDSNLPQDFEHQVAVANLLPEFSNLDVYFVRDDETKDSADHFMTGLDYADSRTITVPNDYYSIVVVYEDNLGIESLLYRSELISFNEDAVYLITIEPEQQTGGYQVNVSW